MNTTEKKIDWLYEVTDCLDRLWGTGAGHQTKNVSRYLNREIWEEDDSTKLELQRRRIMFI